MDTAQRRGQKGPGQGQALPHFHTVRCLFSLHSGHVRSGFLRRLCSVRPAWQPDLCRRRPAHRDAQPNPFMHWLEARRSLAADPRGSLQLLESFLWAALRGSLDAWRSSPLRLPLGRFIKFLQSTVFPLFLVLASAPLNPSAAPYFTCQQNRSSDGGQGV